MVARAEWLEATSEADGGFEPREVVQINIRLFDGGFDPRGGQINIV